MISEFFLNIIFTLVGWMLEPIPAITIPAMDSTSTFFGFVRCGLYLLPLNTIATIVGILVAISLFRIFISIIKTIWDLLPLV